MTQQSPIPDSDSPPREPPAPALRGSTLVITNLAKLAGVVAFINEAMIRGQSRQGVIAVCALLVLGVQAFENVALRVIDSIFRR